MSDLMTDCICLNCSSYTVCAKMRFQSFFCVNGKSPTNCIRTERGCICSECSVGKELGKEHEYYCRQDHGN